MSKPSTSTAAADEASDRMSSIAALDFEAWPDSGKLETLKSLLGEWDSMRSILYLANSCMYLSKAKLVDAFVNEPEALMNLVDCLDGRTEQLREIANMADAARSRLLIAAAAASFVDAEVQA
ncbi:hypothetical protein GTW25_05825 [Aliihoeflea aestuarii]|jgi:glycogen synthase|uniref:hypothetical protein n=1 Tax=Aliihoeflea aestuarii TaxID=453840 RepID=UPI0020922657|nr:hypothetical protein [Aliihoeflea aestuarii]MCO6390544.1 hypothetical protein [Aliihoeflea aestuarii]